MYWRPVCLGDSYQAIKGSFWWRKLVLQKEFYALSVQTVCYQRKRYIWIRPSNQIFSNGSKSWFNMEIYDLIHEVEEGMEEPGLFMVGGSAYPILFYLLIPYPYEYPGDYQDPFNFLLIKSRIHIEWFFEELIIQWGLFLRKIKFLLAN